MEKLSNTLALQGRLAPAHLKTADEPRKPAEDSADLAVTGPGTQFRRQTGAGSESLAEAVDCCREY